MKEQYCGHMTALGNLSILLPQVKLPIKVLLSQNLVCLVKVVSLLFTQCIRILEP